MTWEVFGAPGSSPLLSSEGCRRTRAAFLLPLRLFHSFPCLPAARFALSPFFFHPCSPVEHLDLLPLLSAAMSPLASAGRKAYTPRPVGLTPAVRPSHHYIRSLSSPSIEQKALSRRIILLYNLVLLAFILLLTVRHLALIAGKRRRSRRIKKEIAKEVERSVQSLDEKKQGWWSEEKEREIEVQSVKKAGSGERWERLERWATRALSGRWYCFGLENQLQVAIFLGMLGLNVGFTLVSRARSS